MKKNYFFMGGLLCLYTAVIPEPGVAQTLAMNHLQPSAAHAAQSETRTIHQILKELETRHAIFFMFHSEKIKTMQVRYQPVAAESVQQTLDRVLKANGLNYKQRGKIYAIFPAYESSKSIREFKQTLTTYPTGQATLPGTTTADMPGPGPDRVVTAGSQPAADVTVTGVVKSETGEGLPGVSVVIKSTTRGTTTDANGRFSLVVSDSRSDGSASVLVFSFVGYLNQEIVVGNRTTIDVQLVPDQKSLDEVIVVGYGTQKKSELSGSVSVITPKEISQNPSPNLSNSLVGQAAGIIATQSSGEPGNDASNIFIRGIGTTGDASPIYVIDGIVRSARDFSQLNSSEIQSFSILKDAASAAVFGVRAGNGVILVTTKRGTAGKTQFSYSSNFGVQQRTRTPEYLNAYDYATLYNEALANEGKAPQYSQTDLQKYQDRSDPDRYPNSDWFNTLLRKTAPVSQHNLSVNGGTDKVRYAMSLSYLNQDGVVPNNNYKRYNFRSNIDADVTTTSRISFDLSGRNEQTLAPPSANLASGSPFSSIFQKLVAFPPTRFPIQYTNGNYTNSPGYLFLNENGYSRRGVFAFRGRLQLLQQIPFVPGLSFKAIGSFDKTLTDAKAWNHPVVPFYSLLPDGTFQQQPLPPSSLSQDHYDDQAITLETHLNYEKQFGKNKVSGLVLYTQTRQNWNDINAYRENYTIGIDELNFGPALNRNNGGYSGSSGRQGVVGRFNISHNDKYTLETSFRADGSEQFAPGKRWGFFPSVSGAWVISQESFLQNNKVVDFLKLRGSYGILGNDRLAAARFLYLQSYFASGNAVFGDGSVQQAIGEGSLANPNVTWETIRKLDFGLDATMLRGKLSVTFDYFYDKRSNILGYRSASVPAILGIGLPVENIAKVDNHGIELSIGHNNVVSKSVRYSMNANLTFTRNKIVFIDEPASTNPNLMRTGQPLGTEIGFRALGLFRSQAEVDGAPKQIGPTAAGDIRYEDVNGDGKIDDNDRVPIGRANTPEIIAGYGGSITVKNFELSFLFQGATRVNQWYRGEGAWPFFVGAGALKQNLDRWTPNNPNASEPRVLVSVTNMNQYNNSSFWLRDASYLRLKSVELAYNLPKNFMGQSVIRGLRLYVNANNVFTWTKIKNFDPENQSDRGWGYPQLRIFNAGFNVQF